MPMNTDFIGLSASGAHLGLLRRFPLSSTPSRNIGKGLFRGYQDNTDFGKHLHRLIQGK